jgi:hypothetical protein
VVNKSYPEFWEEMKKVGFSLLSSQAWKSRSVFRLHTIMHSHFILTNSYRCLGKIWIDKEILPIFLVPGLMLSISFP